MYGDLLWPDLDLEPSLFSKLYSQYLALYFTSNRRKFWTKTDNFGVSTARNLNAPILNFDLTLTWFGKFKGCFRIVLTRAFERCVARFSAAIRSRFMTWGRLTPPPPPPSKSRVAKYPSNCRVKTYRLHFPLVNALRCSRVSTGVHICRPRPCEGGTDPRPSEG